VKLSVQLYQVDQKNYLLDFKSLDAAEHPDAVRVQRMVHLATCASAPARLDGLLMLLLVHVLRLCGCAWIGQWMGG